MVGAAIVAVLEEPRLYRKVIALGLGIGEYATALESTPVVMAKGVVGPALRKRRKSTIDD